MPHVILSVVMPVFNHGRYISDSIESILNQTFEDLELLITDDCSTDNSREIIESFTRQDRRVKAIYNTRNCGPSNARNRSLERCNGAYIAFCDSDDIWDKKKAGLQLEDIRSTTEYDVVFCDSIIIDEMGVPTSERFSSRYGKAATQDRDLFHKLCISNFINMPTVMFRRTCLEKAGLFEERLKYGEDWLYWVTLARYFKFRYLDQVLVRYREHPTSTRWDTLGYCQQRIEACRMILERFLEIPGSIKSSLYYMIARQYEYLGNNSLALTNYMRSLRHDKTNIKNVLRILCLPPRCWSTK